MQKRGAGARIVAIILAVLMVLSVAAAVFGVVSGNASATGLTSSAIPHTGIEETWIFYVLGGAVFLAAVCIILPRVIKKKPPIEDDDEF
ncbi:MAG: LPXTG cell wall anchor domain-containing protein [Oscillospiraceae bacterium]|nr:LPXTG cell wall anchor domain-containing protein [Oscillospiraceae bacterium]